MPSQVKAQCDRPDASALSVTYNLASAAELAPPVVRVVAAFHLLAAEALQDLEHELDCGATVRGEKSARERVRPLAESIPGVRYVDGGPLCWASPRDNDIALTGGLVVGDSNSSGQYTSSRTLCSRIYDVEGWT